MVLLDAPGLAGRPGAILRKMVREANTPYHEQHCAMSVVVPGGASMTFFQRPVDDPDGC
jgi:hypothetical protein